ncbi:MAG: Crp/Fnr family transcriptional regulator [Balneolales bacterium]
MDELKNIAEFQTSEKVISELMEHGIIKKLIDGDILQNENSLIYNIPIILNGSVKVYQTDDDYKEILLYYLKAGDTCIMSFFGALYSESSKIKAVANQDSEVLLIPVYKAGLLIKDHPEWINYIFRIYHQRFKEMLEVVNAVAFKKLDERLLQMITKMAEISKGKTLLVTHDALANELGTARVVVSRLLKQLENDGHVKLGRNKITLV